ncbi:hypothetical protein SAMN03159297_03293 [Pseudomonas sp. NFACC45]|nr:hypothetical protein SAMN03159297_03293 [Pseudomonas sp. NFACC45]
MEDDVIDDSGFDLGLPSREEMLEHQCDLLCAELETSRCDLRKAHKNIAGLIVMYRDSSTELAALKVEHDRLKKTLSDMDTKGREQEPLRMGYAYEDYSKVKT